MTAVEIAEMVKKSNTGNHKAKHHSFKACPHIGACDKAPCYKAAWCYFVASACVDKPLRIILGLTFTRPVWFTVHAGCSADSSMHAIDCMHLQLLSVRPSVHPSVRHTLVLCSNSWTGCHKINAFTFLINKEHFFILWPATVTHEYDFYIRTLAMRAPCVVSR